MSRKPAIVEMAGGRSARQRVWEAARRLREDFTAADLSRAAKVEMGIVGEYLLGLTAAGVLRRETAARRAVPHRYWLERDVGIEAPRVRRDGSEVTLGRGVEAMWGVITVLDHFTAQTLADIAGVAPRTAKSYCTALAHAGYLVAGQPGHGTGAGAVATVWRTVKSAIRGPRAPMITRLKAVYDPNVHSIVWCENADDALEACES